MEFIPGNPAFINKQAASPEKAKFLVVPVPYERTTSYYKGAEKGPTAIIEASPQVELWDEELKREVWEDGIYTTAPLDCGGSEEEFFTRLEKTVGDILDSTKALPVFLGGEHSITQGLIPSFARRHRDLSILHFDAHADLRLSYFGSRHSHACAVYPASRTNKTVQVGIRSVGSEEKQFVNAGKVKTFFMHENRDMRKLEEAVLKELSGTVYMTVDVDGFDPSVMPGTGTPQPGGFGWYEGLHLLKTVCENKNIVGADIVEVSPLKGSPITEFNAAKLAYRLMGYIGSGK